MITSLWYSVAGLGLAIIIIVAGICIKVHLRKKIKQHDGFLGFTEKKKRNKAVLQEEDSQKN